MTAGSPSESGLSTNYKHSNMDSSDMIKDSQTGLNDGHDLPSQKSTSSNSQPQTPKIRIKPISASSTQVSPSKSRTTIKIIVSPQSPESRLSSSISDSEGFQGSVSVDSGLINDNDSAKGNVSSSSSEQRRRSGRLAIQERRESQRRQREIEVAKQIEEGNARVNNQVDLSNVQASSSIVSENNKRLTGGQPSQPLETTSAQASPPKQPESTAPIPSTQSTSSKSQISARRKSKRIQESSTNVSSASESQTPEQELVLKRRKFDSDAESATTCAAVISKGPNGETIFNEPPLAANHVGANGFQWSALPTKIDKKEAQRTKLKKYNVLSAGKTHSNYVTEEQVAKNQQLLVHQLKTHESDELQKSSDLRDSVKKSKSHKQVKDLEESRSVPSSVTASANGSSHKVHLKASLSPVKRQIAGLGEVQSDSLETEAKQMDITDPSETIMNNDFCSTCGDTGLFICCEGCTKAFHFACCSPPYRKSTLPTDTWFCHECAFKRKYTKDKQKAGFGTGMFGKLLNNLEGMDPIQFKLPKKIRDRFENVYTAPNGSYSDDSRKTFSASQRPKNHFADPNSDVDFYVDKTTNEPLNCYKCGYPAYQSNHNYSSTQMMVKPIISCDYCPLSWHIDCLSPPMAHVKQTGNKWRCPAHAHGLIKEQRRLRKGQVYIDRDISMGAGNNGDIEIFDPDSAEPMDIPSFGAELRGTCTAAGVSAEVAPQQLKLWKDQKHGITRLSSKGVVVDFANSVMTMKQREHLYHLKLNEVLRVTKENNALLKGLVIEAGNTTNPSSEKNSNDAEPRPSLNLDIDERLALVGLFDLKNGQN